MDNQLNSKSREELLEEELRQTKEKLKKEEEGHGQTKEKLKKRDEQLRKVLDTLVKLYTNKTHFIYELLQNAEDVRANKVCFVLHDNCLEFWHDGSPFTKLNFDSIKDPANSDKVLELQKKKDGYTKIGKFGIGFLATYTICKEARLYSMPENYQKQAKDPTDAFACNVHAYTKSDLITKEDVPDPILDTFACKIHDYIESDDISEEDIPDPIPEDGFAKDYTTRFVFHFVFGEGRCYESDTKLYKDLKYMLKNLGAEVMLYLKNIKSIEYKIAKEDVHPRVYKLEESDYNEWKGEWGVQNGKLCKRRRICIASKGTGEESKYLMYSMDISDIIKEKTVDLVFAIKETGDKIKFVPTSDKHKNISVYFPTEMPSMLKFMIQAPFGTTPSRQTVPNTEENKKLVYATEGLLEEVVYDVIRSGWLTLEFLNILPYKKPYDTESVYKDWLLHPLRETSIALFKHSAILPTIDDSFVKADNAYIAYGEGLTSIFKGEQLCNLVGNSDAMWMPTELTEKRFPELYEFLTKEIKAEKLGVDYLPAKLRKNGKTFFTGVDNLWLKDFYKWLVDAHSVLLVKDKLFNTVPFIKSITGEFMAAYEKIGKKPQLCRFPKDADSSDTNRMVGDLTFVDKDICENCNDFLDAMGIKELDSYDYFCAELDSNDPKNITEEKELSQLERAIRFVNYDKKKIKGAMSNLILRYINTKTGEPERKTIGSITGSVVLYREKDIHAVFGGNNNQYVYYRHYFDKVDGKGVLDEEFYENNEKKIKPDDLCKLLQEIGISVRETDVDIADSGYTDLYVPLTNKKFIETLTFISIHDIIKSKDNMSKNKSVAIWRLLRIVEPCLSLKDAAISKIVKILRGVVNTDELPPRWLYKKDDVSNGVYRTYEICQDELHEDYGQMDLCANHLCNLLTIKPALNKKDSEKVFNAFPDDDKQKIIMDFAKSCPLKMRQELFSEIAKGLPSDIRQVSEQTVDEDRYAVDDNPEFPQEPLNINIDKESLKDKIRDYYYGASTVVYEKILRSTRVSKIDAAWYVNNVYGGICQICRLRKKYSATVGLFYKPLKELWQMNLRLCRGCAPIYEERRRKDEFKAGFREKLMQPQYDDDGIPYVPLDTGINIYFTEIHLFEIQTLLQIEKEEQI